MTSDINQDWPDDLPNKSKLVKAGRGDGDIWGFSNVIAWCTGKPDLTKSVPATVNSSGDERSFICSSSAKA